MATEGLGEHYYYYVTTPCPTALDTCSGEYSGDLVTPTGVEHPWFHAADLSCGGPETRTHFSVIRRDTNLELVSNAEPSAPLVRYSPGDNHHIVIQCQGSFGPCTATRFATQSEALALAQGLACPKTRPVHGSTKGSVELRLPYASFDVIDGDTPYLVVMGGLGLGGRWYVPADWEVPLVLGAGATWLTTVSQPEGAKTTLDRFGVFAEAGLNFRLSWLRGSHRAPPPIDLELGLVYRVGIDYQHGDYRLPDGKSHAIADGQLAHYPAAWIGVRVLLDRPTVTSLGGGIEEAVTGLTPRTFDGVTDTVDIHTAVISAGLNQQRLTLPPPTLATPTRGFSPLQVPTSAPAADAGTGATAATGGHHLRAVSLNDVWGYIDSITLPLDSEWAIKGDGLTAFTTFAIQAIAAAHRHPQAGRLYIRYEVYANSLGSRSFNVTLTQEQASRIQDTCDAALATLPDFVALQQGAIVTSDFFGRGDSMPLDLSGNAIDAWGEGCTEAEAPDKTAVTHSCPPDPPIQEDLEGSRRVTITMQWERDDLPERLYRGTNAAWNKSDTVLRAAKLEMERVDLPHQVQAFPLDLTDVVTAGFANFELLRKLPERRQLTVLVSGRTDIETNMLLDRLLPVIRSARHHHIDIVRTREPFIPGEACAFVIVHPAEALTWQGTDPRAVEVLSEPAKWRSESW